MEIIQMCANHRHNYCNYYYFIIFTILSWNKKYVRIEIPPNMELVGTGRGGEGVSHVTDDATVEKAGHRPRQHASIHPLGSAGPHPTPPSKLKQRFRRRCRRPNISQSGSHPEEKYFLKKWPRPRGGLPASPAVRLGIDDPDSPAERPSKVGENNDARLVQSVKDREGDFDLPGLLSVIMIWGCCWLLARILSPTFFFLFN